MLMLSCVHDPCVNCAAVHYVENEPHNSLVQMHLSRTTPAPSADRPPNLTHPVLQSYRRSTACRRTRRGIATSLRPFHKRTSLSPNSIMTHTKPDNPNSMPSLRLVITLATPGKRTMPNLHPPSIMHLIPYRSPVTQQPPTKRLDTRSCILAATIKMNNLLTSASLVTNLSALNALFTDPTKTTKSRPLEKLSNISSSYCSKTNKSWMQR